MVRTLSYCGRQLRLVPYLHIYLNVLLCVPNTMTCVYYLILFILFNREAIQIVFLAMLDCELFPLFTSSINELNMYDTQRCTF